MASAITEKVSKNIGSEEPLDVPKEENAKTEEVEVLFEDIFIDINNVNSIGGLGDMYDRDTEFKISQKLLFIVGLVNIVTLMFGEFLVLVFFFVYEDKNILGTTETIPCLITSCFSVGKTLLLIYKREVVWSLVQDIHNMWPNIKIESINKIVRENMITAKSFFKVYMYGTVTVAVIYDILPIVRIIAYLIMSRFLGSSHKWDDNLSQAFTIWYPYDETASVWTYVPTYISQIYGGVYVTSLVTAADCFFCLLMAHVTMHFQLLHRRIRNLNMAHDDVTQEEAEGNVAEEIKEIIEYHNLLYALTKKIEALFSFVLFLNLATSSSLICFQIFCVTIAPSDRIFVYIIFLMSSVSEISLICYYGNRLTEESIAVRDAAYECDWVNGNAHQRSAVLMLQIRASKPAEISAMGFTTASLGTFSNILRASWSYFTLLHHVYTGKLE